MKSLDEARKPAKQDEEEEIHQYTKLINRENYSLQSPPILLSLFRTRALRLGPIPPRNTLNSIGSCCSIGWYQVVVGPVPKPLVYISSASSRPIYVTSQTDCIKSGTSKWLPVPARKTIEKVPE
jgi:hypothetical protein